MAKVHYPTHVELVSHSESPPPEGCGLQGQWEGLKLRAVRLWWRLRDFIKPPPPTFSPALIQVLASAIIRISLILTRFSLYCKLSKHLEKPNR